MYMLFIKSRCRSYGFRTQARISEPRSGQFYSGIYRQTVETVKIYCFRSRRDSWRSEGEKYPSPIALDGQSYISFFLRQIIRCQICKLHIVQLNQISVRRNISHPISVSIFSVYTVDIYTMKRYIFPSGNFMWPKNVFSIFDSWIFISVEWQNKIKLRNTS